MGKFLKQLFHSYFLGFGLAVMIYLIKYPTLINREYLTYVAILIFFATIGSTFAFQPQFRHINIWLRRSILWVYMSIISDIGIYIYIIRILKLSRDLTLTMIKVPIILLIILFASYFIVDKIEAGKIKKMNESLKKYNNNNSGGL